MNIEKAERETVGIIKNGRNKQLINFLRTQNKNVVEFAEIKTECLELSEQQLLIFNSLEKFDWLVFTDVFTVECFFIVLENIGFELFELDGYKICAFGEAVADKLRFSQIHSDVIPSKLSAEVILSDIKDYIFDEKQFLKSKFLIVKSQNKISELVNVFEKNAVQFIELEIYKSISDKNSSNTKSLALLAGGAIDRFIFTSPEDLETLLHYAPDKKPNDFLADIKPEATDSVTEQTLRENGLEIF